MQLIRQATLAVACMALSAAALAQVRGIYVVPDSKPDSARGDNNVRMVGLACEKFDLNARRDTPVKCTYIPQPTAVDYAIRGKPDVALFWAVDNRLALCGWIPGVGWYPPGCR